MQIRRVLELPTEIQKVIDRQKADNEPTAVENPKETKLETQSDSTNE